jgi:hypothetical protein
MVEQASRSAAMPVVAAPIVAFMVWFAGGRPAAKAAAVMLSVRMSVTHSLRSSFDAT